METTEIRMITDLDKAIPQSLDFNFEEVKAWLAENLAAYKSMVVTEDAIGASKADKAKIAKISKAISEQRIAIKKRYLEPYNVFEAQMKELSVTRRQRTSTCRSRRSMKSGRPRNARR